MGRRADVVLCTHQHLDHFDQPALQAAAAVAGSRFTLVVPRPIVPMALQLGIPGDRVVGAQPRELLELAGVCVNPVPAKHGVDVSDALLPINGRDFFRETERNMVGNMDFREAVRLAADIGAQALIPMHWELFPHNLGFPGDLMTFAAQQSPELTILTFGRGRRLVYSVAP
jgi:L-ascorbate metabolism protein UlaG (beta-lactamase superfamily)